MRQRGGSLFPSVFPDHNQKQQHYPSSSTAVEAQPLLASTTTDDADIAAGRFPPSSSSAAAAATMPPTKNANAPTTSTTTSLPAAAAIVTTVENNNDNNSNTHLLLADNRQQQQQHLLPPNSNNNNNDRYNNSYDYNINDPYNNDNISNNNHLRMLQQQQQHSMNSLSSLDTAPTSACSINTMKGHPGDLEFFEDALLCPTEPVLVLGMDISDYSKSSQFVVCASGLFFFSLLYGYLQELLSVEVCGRQLGLFLALAQFSGYTVLAFVLRQFVSARHETIRKNSKSTATAMGLLAVQTGNSGDSLASHSKPQSAIKQQQQQNVPLALYLGLSLLRAVDLAMTNLAMQYINYPAKTLMKSSRVVFTMLFGVLIQRKVYKTTDYVIVFAMVVGLAMFMHADANSSAVFHHMGVSMLTISLVCDGTISNMSETIMNKFGVGQDEFIFRLYSISLVAIAVAAAVQGDLWTGSLWMMEPGTYQQYLDGVPMSERTWSVSGKFAVMTLFSTMGFFGSSTSAAITKNFGALTMSITSTARKATTLFLSFFLFNNVCTAEHVAGIAIFIAALTTKSLRRRHHSGANNKKKDKRRSTKRNKSHTPTVVNIKSAAMSTPERLTYRHGRGNSTDGVDMMSLHANTIRSQNLVHVV